MLNIQKNIPLAPYTTFKIGGPAKFFVEAKSESDIADSIDYAKNNNKDFFIFSGGSNLLVSDNGLDGLAIKISNSSIEIKDREVFCGAGTSLSQLAMETAKNNLGGLEWAAGIPGTVGGAIAGNAGAFGGEISDNLIEVKTLSVEEGKLMTFEKKDCDFGYRNSLFKKNSGKFILISAVFDLEAGKREESEKKIGDIIKKRKEKQPRYPSAGSFFKNPVVNKEEIINKFERDTGLKIKDDKIPAGWLIEEVGLKGKKIGGAKVSEKHSNFIINTGNATAEDVIILSSLIKAKVRDRFGIQLEEEVKLIGF
ncbi:MAG: UDP-N-acetylmuramate dehydrogenase [Candidatus Moranbacteria bacterium]|jgi:UDP-N-acetylmuramate dehydrogenase|nr:UDP-N-acetylmuramate dehydrogenase [Candidatus Moranbacteria bacterium]